MLETPEEKEARRKAKETFDAGMASNDANTAAIASLRAGEGPGAPPGVPGAFNPVAGYDTPSNPLPQPPTDAPTEAATMVDGPGTPTPPTPPTEAPPAAAAPPPGAVNVPPTPPADPSQTTKNSAWSNKTSGVKVTAEDIQAQKDQKQLVQDQIKAEKDRGEANRLRAIEDQKTAQAQAAAEKVAQQETEARTRAAEEYVKTKNAKADADQANYEKQLREPYNAKNHFWANQTTPEKIKGGVSLILGVFGGIKDGGNVGADRIIKAVEDDAKEHADRLTAEMNIAKNSRDVATKASANAIKESIEGVQLREAAALKAIAADAESRGRALGIPETELATNEGILKTRQAGLDKDTAYRTRVQQTGEKMASGSTSTVTQNNVVGTGPGAAGGRAAGKMIDLAALSVQQKDDIDVLREAAAGGGLEKLITGKALKAIQDDTKKFTADEKSAGEGSVQARAVNYAREKGWSPRSPYDSLAGPQRAAMNALDLLAEKAAEAIAKDKDAREHVKAGLLPTSSDPPLVMRKKVTALLSMAGAMDALSGQYGQIAGAGAAAGRAQIPGGAGGGSRPAGTTRKLPDGSVWKWNGGTWVKG